ncbi:hypothetical protein EDF46_0582 [Frondihabitans sp. PhB188]|uniref:hypothetical protein n=1 Tax=Frondihabitans sp. PhB188 TaxID=2485200 RepID=UPI000FBF219C|nr:hypothetical protein [Frondihabitans sp. PhB188]ROQ41206.1 hypothetical protein EDF46_0582 [Frondihabitans sp. PhB188]
MPALFIVIIIVGIIVFGLSFLGAALKFLLFVGLIIVAIGIIGWIVRALTGRKA